MRGWVRRDIWRALGSHLYISIQDRSRQGGGALPMATRKHTYHKEFYTITNTQISSSDLQYLFNVRTAINFSCENGDGDSCRGRGGPGSPPDLALRKHFVLIRIPQV